MLGGEREEEARRAEQAGLGQFHPVLRDMTPDEFDRFVDAAARSMPSQAASESLSRIFSTLAVVAIAGCAFLLSGIVLKLLGGRPVVPPPVISGVVTLAAIFVGQVLVQRYHRRWARRTRVLAVRSRMLREFRTCVGCKYDLSSVAAIEGRAGLARCPECGLVNPVSTIDAPAGANAPVV